MIFSMLFITSGKTGTNQRKHADPPASEIYLFAILSMVASFLDYLSKVFCILFHQMFPLPLSTIYIQ
jgi:hypothetical protein